MHFFRLTAKIDKLTVKVYSLGVATQNIQDIELLVIEVAKSINHPIIKHAINLLTF